MPAGRLERVMAGFLSDRRLRVFGCLSVEPRCVRVPTVLGQRDGEVRLVVVEDPPNAYPDHTGENRERIARNRATLERSEIPFSEEPSPLLASEDELLRIGSGALDGLGHDDVLVLDISSFPKRFFCFLLKQFMLRRGARNVVVTYSTVGAIGYSTGPLAEDPMPCDYLPGFAAATRMAGAGLVVSVGFESLGMRSLLRSYHESGRDIRVITAFPADGRAVQRQWRALFDMVRGDAANAALQRPVAIAAWDAAAVFEAVTRWSRESGGVTLAPFGPKTHTLGMALFAMRDGAGVFYSQPKSYNPIYSTDCGETWAYVVKWEGVACYDRARVPM